MGLWKDLGILFGDILGFRVTLRPTTDVLIIRGESEREGPREGGSRAWSNVATSQRMLGVLGAARSGKDGRKGRQFSPGFRGAWPP